MASFAYRARTTEGALVHGRLEAAAAGEAVARLRAQGLVVVQVERERDLGWALSYLPALQGVPVTELALFLRQLATMVSVGLPVVSSLRVLARQTRGRVLRAALQQAVQAVEEGQSLSAAFLQTRVFPRVMVQMIGAGEVGGILDAVLDRLASQVEQEDRVRHKVRSALIYPAVVSLLALLVISFLIVFVVPRFVQFFSDMGGQLPAVTRGLIAASALARRWWWLLLLALAGGWAVLRTWAGSESGSLWLDRLLLRLPVCGGLVQKYNLARFCRVLSGLMGSGVPILQALAVAETVVGNREIGTAILGALDSVRQGQGLAPPLQQSGLFPPMVVEMIAIGEQSGTLEPMLARVAGHYEEEVQRLADGLSGTLEPFVIFFLALVVGAVVVAMVAPVFDLWTLIG